MDISEKPVKEKRRNSEKRKEKSRDAARCRRSKESEIFSDLAQVLPFPPSTVNHLDKASIMRLVIAHLRVRSIFRKIKSKDQFLKPEIHDGLFLKALGGIVIVVSLDGDIVYISNNVSIYLGISQVDLLGHSIYDISHPCDHTEIRDLLTGKMFSNEGLFSIFLRVKCTLTNKGKNVNLKSASYKVLHITGNLIKIDENDNETVHFVSIGSPIPHPANIEAPLGTYTFLSKHSVDMKYTYADERMNNFLGYNPENLIGKSLYEFHHVLDSKEIVKAFKSLFSLGQSETGQYRFLAKGGGYVWVYTQATLIYSDKGRKPNSVICVNYVLSERQNEIEIYSCNQLEGIGKKVEDPTKPVLSTSKAYVNAKEAEHSPRPQPATAKIFAPRTEDMNKGFLMFSDDDSGFTILKDEPEDLTHLAPTAGDVCVPLSTPMLGPLFNNMMVPLTGGRDYSPLIKEDKETPFFASYRDDVSSGSVSPTLSQSPGGSSLPSLCSLGDETTRFEETTMKSLLGLDQTLDLGDTNNDDLAVKAPYIPMSEGDDLPLLLASDLMWAVNFPSPHSNGSNSSCSPSPAPDIKIENNCSSLANLLKTDAKQSTSSRCQDQGGGDKTTLDIDRSFPIVNICEVDKRKRSSTSENFNAKKRKQQPKTVSDTGGENSVLMNLLIAGCDVSAGYICLNPRKSQVPPKTSQNNRRNS